MKLYNTLDPSEPLKDWLAYTGPIHVTSNLELNAIGVDEAGNKSEIASAAYVIDLVPPAAPEVSPAGGIYAVAQDVELDHEEWSTPGSGSAVTIRYTLDGTPPDESSATYTAGYPIHLLDGTTTVRAVAIDGAGHSSSETSRIYTIDTVPPVPPAVSPTTGIYPEAQDVVIDHDEWSTPNGGTAVTVYYTLDGTTPNTLSQEYSGESLHLPDGTTTVRAVAVDEAGHSSTVVSRTYTIDTVAPENPILSEASGEHSAAFDLTISHSEPTSWGTPVALYYTVGSIDEPPPNPTVGDLVYGDPILVDRNRIIKAVAIDQAGNASGVVSATYTFLRIDADPFTPSSCPINSSPHYVYIDGYFGMFFDAGVYINGTAQVLLTQASEQVICYPDGDASVAPYRLRVLIWGPDLVGAGMVPGPATITVNSTLNGDSVSTEFGLD